MLVILVRVVILYALVVVMVRVMGKRQIGEMQPFELVITILVADLAATPMEDTGIPLINGIIPIITLLFLEAGISVIALKSEGARKIIDGTPSIILDKGKLQYHELKKQRININDLLEHLRAQGYPYLHELDYVILEPDGDVSVIEKAENRPLTPKDMNIAPQEEGLPTTLIIDGIRNKYNMRKAQCSDEWLNKQLKLQNIKEDKEVLLAYINSQKQLYVQKRNYKSR